MVLNQRDKTYIPISAVPMPARIIKLDGSSKSIYTSLYNFQINQNIIDLIGANESSLLGFDWWQFIQEEDRSSLADTIQKVLESCNTCVANYSLINSDGLVIQIEESFSFIDKTSVAGFLRCTYESSNKELDHYKKIEEIESKNSFYERCLSLAGVGAWQLDLDSKNLFWTKVTYDIHEIGNGEIIDVDEALNFYAPEARPLITRAVSRGIEAGGSWNLKLPLITRSGKKIMVHAIGEPCFIENKVTSLQGIFKDITYEYDRELAILRNQERLFLATSSTGSGAWEWDIESNVLWWDDQMFKIYNKSKDEFCGVYDDWKNCVHPDDVKLCEQQLQDCIESKEEFHTNFRIVLPNKEIRTISADGMVIRDKYGNAERIVGVNCDITDHIVSMIELENARMEAEQANNSKSVFLANMSHEIRTPLSAIIGLTDQLLSDQSIGTESRKILSTIIGAGEHLLALINDILDLSKITSSDFSISPIEVNLNEIITSITNLYKPRVESKGLEFKVIKEFPLPVVINTDKIRIMQMLHNLIGNAIKYTEEGYINIRVVYKKEEGKIHFDVKDTGSGVSEDSINFLGRPFYQADNAIEFQGTGLGLSIVKSLSDKLGGKFYFKSQLGKGSTFSFSISPGKIDGLSFVENFENEDGLNQETQKEVQSISVSDSSRVLIADDGEDIVFLISTLLDSIKVKHYIARNGAEALEIAKNKELSLIIMDIQMPVMDGIEATQKIRDVGLDVPILAVTANVMQDQLDSAMQAGCNDYLLKPFRKKDFTSKVSKFLAID